MNEHSQNQNDKNENSFNDAAETTSNLITTTSGMMQDALKAAGVGADDIAIIQKHADVKNVIISGAELMAGVIAGDGEAVAKSATVIAAGAIATAISAAVAPAALAGIAGAAAVMGAGYAVNRYWQEIKDLAKAADNKIDELQDWAATSLLNGLLALSAKLGAPDLLNSATGLNDQDPAAAFASAELNASPIVLDLDGDGITTLSKDQGIHFDLDNNGMAETVGWVSGEDGLLVRDINGNGTIDSGAELMGNHTLLENGDNAANGYQALAELDSNGDGIISSDDTAFTELKVWQDTNSDGISQQDELISLTDAGIASLNTGYQNVSDDDGHSNITQQTSTATKTDGSVIDTADIWFSVNLTQTVNRNQVALSEELLALPEAYAFGNVRSLRQSMANDAVLTELVSQFTQVTDDSERLALIDTIIYQWTGSADIDPDSRTQYSKGRLDSRQLVTLENLVGRDFLQHGYRSNPLPEASLNLGYEYQHFKSYVTAQLLIQTHYRERFPPLSISYNLDNHTFKVDTTLLTTTLKDLLTRDKAANESTVTTTLQILRGLASYSTPLQTQLQIIQADSTLGYYAAEDWFTGTDTKDTLVGSNHDDYIQGFADDDGLTGGAGNDVLIAGTGHDRLNGGIGHDHLAGDADNDWLYGGEDNDTLLGGSGDDYLQGDAGADRLLGGAGNDRLYGNADDDILAGGAGDDTVSGGAGSDSYHWGWGDGNDSINDYDYYDTRNSDHQDTLVFGGGVSASDIVWSRKTSHLVATLTDEAGSSQALTVNYWFNSEHYQVEQLQLADGTVLDKTEIAAATRIIYGSEANDRLYGFNDSADTLLGLAGDDQIYGHSADDRLEGGAGDDSLQGDAGADTLLGGAGDDRLDGGADNDILAGGAGNDSLSAGSGDDVLSGGAGDDTVSGGTGSDSYHWGWGDGNDKINDYNYQDSRNNTHQDTVIFGVGISASDIAWSRNSNHLVATLTDEAGNSQRDCCQPEKIALFYPVTY